MRIRIVVALAAMAGAGLVVATAGPATAAAHQVTNGNDSGAGSFRQAILDANADADPVTITFDPGLAVSFTGAEVQYSGSQPITIEGNGSTVDAGGGVDDRVLEITNAVSLTIDGLTITGGNSPSNTGGGAIRAAGSVTLVGSTLSANASAASGGGIRATGDVSVTDSTVEGNRNTLPGLGSGGGIASSGAVTVTNSTVSGNTAGVSGGGIDAVGAVTLRSSTVGANTATVGAGGGIRSESSVTVTGSTVSANTTGGGDGGGIRARESATITDSTVSGNTASAAGGGIASYPNRTVTLVNSTVTGNTAEREGGGVASGDVALVYATVTSNVAPVGANIEILTFDSITAFGSVVALPQGGGTNCGFEPPPVTNSFGYNFSDDTSCGFANTAQGDRQDAGAPGLGALADNGGPTQTRLPQAGSPLIDAIPEASCQADGASGITTDQRGLPRPALTGCDIGAVEVQPAPPPAAPPAAPVQAVARFTG